MLYQHDDNYEIFMECIGKLSDTIEDSNVCNFNSAVDTHFDLEFVECCSAS